MRNAAYGVPALIFVFLAAVYFITARGYAEVSDSVFSMRTVQSIIEKGTFAIDAESGQEGWVFRAPSGEIFSKYGIGLPILWIPFGAAAKAISAVSGIGMMSVLDFLVSFHGIFFGAGACVIAFHIARLFRASVKTAAAAALALGLCTACWRYSVSDLSEISQAFFMLACVYCVIKDPPDRVLTGSAAFGMLLLIKIVNMIYLPAFLAYMTVKSRPEFRAGLFRAARFLIFPCMALALIAAMNHLRFGNPFESGYGREVALFSVRGMAAHIWQMLFSAKDGLFIFSPVLLLGAAGYSLLFRAARSESIFFASILLICVAVFSTWHSYSSRFMVPVMPLLIFPAFMFAGRSSPAKRITAVLIAVSFATQFTAVMQPRSEYKDGIFLWYRLLAVKFDIPALNFIPLLFAPLIIMTGIRLVRSIKREDRLRA